MIKCVNNEGFEDQLTVGHNYYIMDEGENGYLILNDAGQKRSYGAGKFRRQTV